MPKKTIIVAPLNWGLGHATRCIPLIYALREEGATVILASDGAALMLLRREFPDLESHDLPPYNIRYPFRSMILSIALQLPKLLRGCLGEYFWLRRFLKTRSVDAVISDSRFGFFSRKIPSVFVTHQVQILVPIPFLQGFANCINRFFMRRFCTCWVPDFADFEKNISGKLGHLEENKTHNDNKSINLPLKIGKNSTQSVPSVTSFKTDKVLKINYLGAVSRFKNTPSVQRYHIAFVLSGPEPQRDFLEARLWAEIQKLDTTPSLRSENFESSVNVGNMSNDPKILFVRGTNAPMKTHLAGWTESREKSYKMWKNVEIHDVLTSFDLNQKLLESAVVVCRSGYSSLMDLWALQIPAILIPTEGQTEQEYLADKLKTENRFFSQKQTDFDLQIALNAYSTYTGFTDFPAKNETLPQIVREFLIL